jgi:hypothetical protein
MPALQLTLTLRTRRTQADRAREDAHILEGLIKLLSSRDGSLGRVRADTICDSLGWPDRRVRAAAEASAGRILSAPGVSGYRLAIATPVKSYYELERRRYVAQIQQMQQRLTAMDRAVHAAGAQ